MARHCGRPGHTVHVPDLYDGATFETIPDGVGHARSIGFDTILGRGQAIADALPSDLVYIGFSLGVLPTQMLAQTRPGAKGALLLESCVPVSEFSERWPDGVPVEIHGMDADPSFAGEGDLDAANELVAATPGAKLYLYQGDHHLFADSSLKSYVPDAAELLEERVLAFLAAID